MADATKVVRGGLKAIQLADKMAEEQLAVAQAAKAADRANAGRMAADVTKATAPMKMSEALGNMNLEGKGKLKITQADRTRVGGGNIGGPMFSGLQQVDPFYKDAAWGVGKKSTASSMINQSDDNTLWSTVLGSAEQLKTNPIVFNKLRKGFTDSMKQGNLSDELAGKINHNLGLVFGEGADIRDPKIWQKANTFDKRAALADAMLGQGIPPSKGGVALGGEKSGKGVIFRPTDILKKETEPMLLHPEHGGNVPTFAVGPRLFSLSGETMTRPDLHPGFPVILKGEDKGVVFDPVAGLEAMPAFVKRHKEVRGREPAGYYDWTTGLPNEGLPTQPISEEYLTYLQKLGKKKGGAVSREESLEDMARFQKRFAMHKAVGGVVSKKMASGGRASIFDAPKMAGGGRASIFDKPVHMVDGGKVAKGLMGAIEKASTAADAAMAKPTVDRLSMSYKDVTKRVPEVADAVDKLLKGEITKAQYNDIVKTYKPVTPYSFVPKPATKEEAVGALRGDAAKERYGKQAEYEPGSKIGLRLDIPAYTGKGVWVNSIHDEKGKKVAYGPVASVKNADLGISQNESKRIALGGAKAPYARIKGDWNPITEEEAIAKAQEYLNHPEWKQIGMDPERHSYFYDRRTMQPITNAEEIIQIGPLVLGKNPKYGSIDDFEYADGGKVASKLANAFKKASNAADAAMAEKRVFKTSDGYTFRETPTGEVTNGDMTWPSAKEFMKDMPHAYQQGDDLGKRKAMIEGYGRPNPENLVRDISESMPDSPEAQFQRALNKQNAPASKPNLTVVKADGGKIVRGGLSAMNKASKMADEKIAADAIGKAAESAGMKAPVTANKPLTTMQDFHTSFGDSVRKRAADMQAIMDSFNYKYDKGQRVFTEDSARKNWPPMTVLGRVLEGNRIMREDPNDFLSKKVIDEATGKAKRTPHEPGYKVRLEHSPDNWSEFVIPESAIKGNVDMANGGATRMPPKKTEGFEEEKPMNKSTLEKMHQAVKEIPKLPTSPLGSALNLGYEGYKYFSGKDPVGDFQKDLNRRLNPKMDTGSVPVEQFEKFAKGGVARGESPEDMARFQKRFAMHKAIGGSVKKPQKFDGGGIAAADVGSNTEDKGPTKAGLMAEFLAQMAKDQAKEEYQSFKKPRAATDIANRGILAPALGAPVDLMNMGLMAADYIGSKATGKPIRLSSEKPFGGSEHLKDLMDKYGVTSGEDRPLTETSLSLFSPTGMIKGAMGMTKGAVKAADAMRRPRAGAMREKTN